MAQITIDDITNNPTPKSMMQDIDSNFTELYASGDSTLHYHSSDRDRTNHTGTQTASTISDFDTEVANNSAVTANTAKVSNATHTGDVTGDTTLTIANDAVTYAKIQNVVNDERILGRVSGADGIIEELTATQVRTMINVEDGAEVNNISDVNATDLTDAGETTLHYHSSDRDRANHTGTQLASTISDFQTATESYSINNVVEDTTPQLGGNLDANGHNIEGVTPTEMSYLSGITSGIQDQIDSKINRNVIINGNMNIWQRNTSFTSIADNTYNVDRYFYRKTGVMVHDLTRDTDVPGTANFQYSMKLDCTNADADIAAGDLCTQTQPIEGYNFKQFVGKTATLSFWVKATKTGTYCISFRNSVSDRSYVSEYTVNSSNTWEKKEITLTFDYTGGTWNFVNGVGLQISWVLAAGSTFQTTADTWQTGNYLATSNQVNACDNIGNLFRLTGIQLELGSIATEFEYRTIQQELILCQRYYEKSYSYDVFPGAITQEGAHQSTITTAYFLGSGSVPHNVIKRTDPTIILYSTNSGNSGKGAEYDTGSIFNSDRTASAVGIRSNDKSFTVQIDGTGTAGYDFLFHHIADAEL